MHDTRWRLLAVQLYTGDTELISKGGESWLVDCIKSSKKTVKENQSYLNARKVRKQIKNSNLNVQCMYLYRVTTCPAQPRWRRMTIWRVVALCAGQGGGRGDIQYSSVHANQQQEASSIYSRNTAHNTATLLPPASCRHRHTWTTFWVWVLEVSTKFRGLYIAYKHLPASKQINLNESLITFHKSENWTHFQRATRFYWQPGNTK